MALTQESILSLLISEGGKVKKSDLVGKFKASLDCYDPAEKERNRENFKTFVNNVAFVKEIDGVRYVVVKKMYQHLLDGDRTGEKSDNKEVLTGEQQRLPAQSERTERCDDAGEERSAVSEPDQEKASGESSENPKESLSPLQPAALPVPAVSEPDQEKASGESSKSSENPQESLSPLQLALQRSKGTDFRVKRMLNFEIQTQETNAMGAANKPASIQSKPYGLPLRMPPTKPEICKLKVDPDEHPESPTPDTFRNKRGPPSTEAEGIVGSPLMGRAVKSIKASEESKEIRVPSSVPLEQSEHEWLVKCATGQWSQVYGLLLRDSQLAEKRDFMSGFTALHWAAKCGNSKMLVKIIDLAKQGGVDIDINAKTHGGYTPLHIAALHDQEFIIAMLVGEYGADWSIRDNCGKRAYHYLHKGISGTVREMLGEPKAQEMQDRALQEKEELDLLPDLSKGLHSLGRLFQPHGTGYRKKQKQRPGLFSLSDDPNDEREDSSSSSFRSRILSEVFM